MQPRSRRKPIIALLTLLSASLLAAGCADHGPELHAIEGEPVEIGHVLHVVQITRFLNPDSVEDRAYLKGLPPEPKGKDYLGVFIRIKNEGDDATTVPANYKIVDTRENRYSPLEVDNPFTLDLGSRIEPHAQVPKFDTAAASGPVKGSLMVFELPEDAGENRPLELIVPDNTGGESGSIELDL